MKPWSETLALPKPLRDVRPKRPAGGAPPTGAPAGHWPAAQDELRASYERGRMEAEKTLSEQIVRQRNEVHELMRGTLDSLRNAVPQIMRDAENAMIALALSVAQKLVADMPISVAMIEAAVRDALTQVEGTAQFTVRLHPADLELLQKFESPLLASGDGAKEFRFLSSLEVTRGGCLVQTQFGTVDARRETKFDLLKRSLLR
ncbi:MAG: FliH/SctL family protein [Verrucomicrobiota bacterium]|jgi:flagellar biosynthesis/type III secretory pathway protein FliH